MLPDFVEGEETGAAFPTTIEAFRKDPLGFLTRAFRASGALPADDAVVAITRDDEFVGGGMGRKLLLDVEYARGDGLGKQLFVKFPHDEGHPQRELFTWPMQAEVRFYLMSMQVGLPVAVPRGYFADFNSAAPSGITITERIDYGSGTVEAPLEKCQDYKLDDQYQRYRIVTAANAALAGAHKSGALGPDVAAKFPFPGPRQVAGERFPYTAADVAVRIERLRDYARRAPHLLPKDFASPAFLDRFERETRLVLENQALIYDYLNSATDFIALAHWNINIDNAWFWRDRGGELQVGFLDWGSVAQMNIARAFWGMVCAAELDLLDSHRGDLMQVFVDEYRAAGGPAVTVAEFAFMYRLAVSVDAFHWMIDAPSIVETHLPDFADMTGREDPRLQGVFLARAQQHILTVMLNEFAYADVTGTIAELKDRLASTA